MNLALIGYRATGKTTVGRVLADELGWTFADSDAEIVAAAGCSIADIFAQQGESAFRDLEEAAVAKVLSRENTIASLGGGAVLRSGNQSTIQAATHVVWLTASAAAIHQRMSADLGTGENRPNLTSVGGLEEIKTLLAQRRELYAKCATCQVDTEDRTVDEIVKQILAKTGLGSKPASL